jgi:DnaA family protein
VDRGTGSLFRLLDRLDRAGLAAQKKLTVPFVRSVLDGRD